MTALPAPIGEALRTLRARPGRGVLVALTAALAVCSMVGVRTLLAGQVSGVREDIGRLGLRTVQVQPIPGPVMTAQLSPDDLEHARRIATPLGATVLPAVVALANLTAGDAAAPSTPVLGTTHDYLATLEVSVREGRFFSAAEAARAAKVVVLDAACASALFGDSPAVGGMVTVGPGPAAGRYKIIGVLADPMGNRDSMETIDRMGAVRGVTARLLSFRNAYVPLECMPTGRLSAIMAVASVGGDPDALSEALAQGMDAEGRGLFVWSRRSWIRSLSTLLEDQSALGDLVWGIVVLVSVVTAGTLALLVSADRTAEIGLRRAEGATRSAVFLQFVCEGVLQASVGGVVGLGIGAAAGHVLAAQVGLRALTEGSTLAQAMGVAVGVGVLASAAPAVRAARLSPVEALRGG